jgi:transposase-like protein
MSRFELRSITVTLSKAAAAAGDKIGPSERTAIAKWTRQAQQSARPAPATAPAARRAGTGRSPKKKQAGSGDSDLDRLADAVRTILQKAASQRETLTWPQVRDQLPAGLPPLARTDQTTVLIRVDRSRSARNTRAGLLSALVTGADHDMHPAYPRVAAALGRPIPSGRLEALAEWAVEVSRIQHGNSK